MILKSFKWNVANFWPSWFSLKSHISRNFLIFHQKIFVILAPFPVIDFNVFILPSLMIWDIQDGSLNSWMTHYINFSKWRQFIDVVIFWKSSSLWQKIVRKSFYRQKLAPFSIKRPKQTKMCYLNCTKSLTSINNINLITIKSLNAI